MALAITSGKVYQKMIFFLGLMCVVGFCIGLPMVTYSGEYVLQIFDSFAGNLPLLLIAIFECVGVCYCYGIKR